LTHPKVPPLILAAPVSPGPAPLTHRRDGRDRQLIRSPSALTALQRVLARSEQDPRLPAAADRRDRRRPEHQHFAL